MTKKLYEREGKLSASGVQLKASCAPQCCNRYMIDAMLASANATG
ncbi:MULTISPECIES: hypothetical protein [unclassified Nostoc]|nr:hypothetical protein [Nostoc sp. KVJ20]